MTNEQHDKIFIYFVMSKNCGNKIYFNKKVSKGTQISLVNVYARILYKFKIKIQKIHATELRKLLNDNQNETHSKSKKKKNIYWIILYEFIDWKSQKLYYKPYDDNFLNLLNSKLKLRYEQKLLY